MRTSKDPFISHEPYHGAFRASGSVRHGRQIISGGSVRSVNLLGRYLTPEQPLQFVYILLQLRDALELDVLFLAHAFNSALDVVDRRTQRGEAAAVRYLL
jgi:hypothetical protein